MLQLADIMPVSTELPGIISTSALSVAIIQWLKKSKHPSLAFINQHSDNVNIFANIVAAFVSATGLHFTYDSQLGTILLTNLTPAIIRHGVFETARSYAFNWLIYEGIVKKRAADVAAIQEG